ncbi:histidine kinase [Actinotalea ferrariae CF5-4]|uniref:Histidine kinase n=1 Tax=Actinotalea ferrariae CF5-4 TaxID=948458 RepID=A0A021VVL3_9CELL|nr:SpoIIE family protein phosphatase [Actinotalea ferrariae]EYR65158.1 histidine kinase [Actinotalea ferrariae CF5-4]
MPDPQQPGVDTAPPATVPGRSGPSPRDVLGSDDAAETLVGLLGAPAVRAARVGTFAWDLRSGTVAVDRAFAALLGLDDLVATGGDVEATVLPVDGIADRLHPHDRARIAQALLGGREGEDEITVEYRALDTTDEPRWLLTHARLVRDDAGAVLGAVGSVIDSTSLSQGEARTTRLLEAMPTALFLLDRDWRFTYLNAEAERMLGRSRRDTLGRDLWELYPDSVGTVWEERYRHAVETGQPVVFDVQPPAPPVRWLEVRAWPGPDGLAVYLLDVTQARDATHALEHAARRGSLLAEITAVLAGSADPEDAVRALADRVVPELADWAIVTLVVEDGNRVPSLRDVATRHADPASQPLADRYAAVRLQQLTSGSYVDRVMSTGEIVHLEADATAKVRAVLRPGEARDLLDALAPHTGTLLPLRARGRTLGLLSLFNHDGRPSLDQDELRLAEEIAARAGLALDNARLRERQVRLAERLQRSMLTEPVRGEDLRIAVRYVPSAEAAQVGGDWYDAFRDADGSTLVVIGDVVGHDNEAVAAMGQLRSLLRGIAVSEGPTRSTPGALLHQLDRAVELLQVSTMASLVVARLEPTADGDHLLHWSNAGHPPPLLLSPDGEVRPLVADRRDLFVGVTVDAQRTDSTVRVGTGTTVLLYTDGLVERRDRPARDGVLDLQQVLRGLGPLDLEDLCDAVLERMLPDRAQDDVALLAVQVSPDDDAPATADETIARTPGTLAGWPPSAETHGTVVREDRHLFTIDPDAPLAEARAWASDRSAALGAGPEELTVVALLTSEVASNATRHGSGGAVLEVVAVDGGVRITVTDHGDGLPQVLHPDAGTPGGRGVWLVSELSRAWGVELLPGGGKAVWFEVEVPGVMAEDADQDGHGSVPDSDGPGGRDRTAEDDVAVLELTGYVDADTRDELLVRVDEVLASGRPVVVRCEGLDFVDSTGLAALSRLATGTPEPPRIVGAPVQLRRMLHLTGLDALVRLD